jgi:hypothetical protein
MGLQEGRRALLQAIQALLTLLVEDLAQQKVQLVGELKISGISGV